MLTGLIPWGMRQSAEMENHMTSVERIIDFTSIEREPNLKGVCHIGFNINFIIIYLICIDCSQKSHQKIGHKMVKLFLKTWSLDIVELKNQCLEI